MSFQKVLKFITGLDSYEDMKQVVRFAVALENEFGELLKDSDAAAWGFDEDANVYIPDPAVFEEKLRTNNMSRVNVTKDLWKTSIKVSFVASKCTPSCSQ
jgi:hypothetical protein